MGFGDGVEALLETYSKCLALLRVFSAQSSASSGSSGSSVIQSLSPVDWDWDHQSSLSRSLRSDRAKVQKAYSSRLSETGRRLEKGDGRSQSALRRIVRRLADALASILSIGGTRSGGGPVSDNRPLLNYDALRALSNTSRVDAIHAIDELSVRLSCQSSKSSRTGSGRASPSSASSSHAVCAEHQKRHQNVGHHNPPVSSNSHESRSSDKRVSNKLSNSRPNTLQTKRASRETRAADKGDAKQVFVKHKRSSTRSGHGSDRGSSRGVTSSHDAAGRLGRRASLVSSSSASTRLGEIPERKRRCRLAPAHYPEDGWDRNALEYNVRPAYPMRPSRAPEGDEERSKKGFWGLFRRE